MQSGREKRQPGPDWGKLVPPRDYRGSLVPAAGGNRRRVFLTANQVLCGGGLRAGVWKEVLPVIKVRSGGAWGTGVRWGLQALSEDRSVWDNQLMEMTRQEAVGCPRHTAYGVCRENTQQVHGEGTWLSHMLY